MLKNEISNPPRKASEHNQHLRMASASASASPKILLAKPGVVGGGAEEEWTAAALRSRGSLNLLSDTWEFHYERFLPLLTENTEFTVVGVIGPPGVGKSTIMNLLYAFNPTPPPGGGGGMVPPFAVHSPETRAHARHCTSGIEPRIAPHRFILLDTHPVFSPSVLADITRPDGSSTIPLFPPEPISSDLAHHLLSLHLGVLLASVCHVLLVVSEGVHDPLMWRFLSTVDLLKRCIPDPSSLTLHSHSSNSGADKDNKDKLLEGAEEFMALPVFVHTKLRDEDLSPQNCHQMRKVLAQYFWSASFMKSKYKSTADYGPASETDSTQRSSGESKPLDLFLVPRKQDNSREGLYESHDAALWKIRDHVLSLTRPPFSRTVSERDWLKNTAKIWDMVKKSAIITEYGRMLQNSGLFRR